MRFQILVSVIVSATASSVVDPCSALCRHDGPSICTGGSWTKNGICHAYVYRGNPLLRDYCYHTAATAATCPSSGKPVKAADVALLLSPPAGEEVDEPIRSRPTDAVPATTTTTTTQYRRPEIVNRPPIVVDTIPATTTTTTRRFEPPTVPAELYFTGDEDDFAALIEALGIDESATTSTTTVRPQRPVVVAAASPELQAAINVVSGMVTSREAASRDENFLTNTLEPAIGALAAASRATGAGIDAFEIWRRVQGGWFLGRTWRGSPTSNELIPIIMLATNLNVARDQMANFVERTGFSQFCTVYEAEIRRALSAHANTRWNWRRFGVHVTEAEVIADTFAADLSLYCPNILNTVALKKLAFAHRFHRVSYRSRGQGFDIRASRNRAFEDAIQDLSGGDNIDNLRRGVIRVRFRDEQGVGPGIIRDWFTEVAHQIYNPQYALFQLREDEAPHYTQISPLVIHQDNYRNWLRAVGRFMALAIIQGNPIGVTLPVMFFGKLIDAQVGLDDIASDEPMLHRSLSYIMNSDAAGLAAGGFEISLNGRDHAVTVANRVDLVGRKINSLIDPEVEGPFQEIRAGFNEVIPIQVLSGLFTPGEVRGLMFGNPTIDVEDLIRNAVFGGGYSARLRVIEWLFGYLRTLDQESLKKLLRFSTGNTQLPLGGFAMLNPRFTIDSGGAGDRLPTASTCFNQLHLPMFTSELALRTKMNQAITETGDFGRI